MALLRELQLYCSFWKWLGICLIWLCQCKIRGILGFTNNITELPEWIGHRKIILQIKRVEPLEVWCFYGNKTEFWENYMRCSMAVSQKSRTHALWFHQVKKILSSLDFIWGCIYAYIYTIITNLDFPHHTILYVPLNLGCR